MWLLRLLDSTNRLDVDAVLLRDGPFRGELESRGIAVIIRPVGPRARDIVAASWWFRRRLKVHDTDVVVANGIKAQAVAGPAATAGGVPVVWVKHDHSYDALLTPALARLANRVVVTTRELMPAVGRTDTVVIEPPRPADQPLPAELAASRLVQLGVPSAPGRLLVAMATRLAAYKGVDTAIRALTHEPATAWDLVVFGDDDASEPGERRRLEQLASSLGVRERVHLVGHVPDAARLLTACHALAVLTRPAGRRTPGREGFSMAAMEAMLAGLSGRPVSRGYLPLAGACPRSRPAQVRWRPARGPCGPGDGRSVCAR